MIFRFPNVLLFHEKLFLNLLKEVHQMEQWMEGNLEIQDQS